MLNTKYKKEALTEAKFAAQEYKLAYEEVIRLTNMVHAQKQKGAAILQSVDEYIHSVSKKPEKISVEMMRIDVNRQEFEHEVHKLMIEAAKTEKVSGSIAGTGALMGAGIAVFGPSAAMAIATTFGTASTGTAIATLSGAAATNAALAWLGGGALAAGGAGVAGGQVLLAMAGPVGWAIGAAVLIGGGALMNRENKKIAEKAIEQIKEIKGETVEVKRLSKLADEQAKTLKMLNAKVRHELEKLSRRTCRDYRFFTENMKDTLILLINTSEALSKKLGVKIDG